MNKDAVTFSKHIFISFLDNAGTEQWIFEAPFVYVNDDSDEVAANHPISRAKVAGTVGLNAFGDSTMQFDLVKKTLSLYTTPQPVTYVSDALVLPIRPKKDYDLYTINLQIDKADKDDNDDGSQVTKSSTYPLLVDTGASFTILPEELRKELNPAPIRSSATMTYTTDTTVGQAPVGLVEKLPLSTLQERNVTVMWANSANQLPLVLGIEVLSRFRVTLDQRNKVLVLEKAQNHDAMENLVCGWAGMNLSKSIKADEDTKAYVATVFPELKAHGAVPLPGDEIVSIDGITVAPLSVSSTSRLLNYGVGKDAKIVLNRKGKLITTRVERLPLYQRK